MGFFWYLVRAREVLGGLEEFFRLCEFVRNLVENRRLAPHPEWGLGFSMRHMF